MHSIIQWLRTKFKINDLLRVIAFTSFPLQKLCVHMSLFSTIEVIVKTQDICFGVSSPLEEGIHVVIYKFSSFCQDDPLTIFTRNL